MWSYTRAVFGDGTDSGKDIFIVITVIKSCYIHNDGLMNINVIKLSESIICEQCWIDGNKWTCNHGLQSFRIYWEYYRWSFISISRNREWFEDHYWWMKSDKLIWYAIRVVILIRTFVWFFSHKRNRLFLVWCWYLNPLWKWFEIDQWYCYS